MARRRTIEPLGEYRRDFVNPDKNARTQRGLRPHDSPLTMREHQELQDLIRRAAAGDQEASADLVAEVEPFLRRCARIRMRNRADFERLRMNVGASDICQSVLKSLFLGLKRGRYELDEPGRLERLLRTMVNLTIASKARVLSVRLRQALAEGSIDERPGPESPESAVDDKDLLEAVHSRFSADELEILNLWLDEKSWDEIATQLGKTAEACRKKLKRAIERVGGEMRSDRGPGI
jgi:RNA polymerase sigma factor (sigma-70 family)